MPSFTKSCRNIRLNGETLLVADCLNHAGEYVPSAIDLDQILSNQHGELVWGGTNFSHSARNIVLNADGWLNCELGDGDGDWVAGGLDLNMGISNQNGVLTRGVF